MKDLIIRRFKESAELKTAFAKKNCDKVIEVVHLIAESLKSGNKIMLFGNGGSAADAQHIAAEFINRLQKSKRDRPPLAALALTTDTSVLTSISNDSDFSNIFSRQIRALGKKGDIAWGISTSGHSPNMIKALKTAQEMEIVTFGLTGKGGGVKWARWLITISMLNQTMLSAYRKFKSPWLTSSVSSPNKNCFFRTEYAKRTKVCKSRENQDNTPSEKAK